MATKSFIFVLFVCLYYFAVQGYPSNDSELDKLKEEFRATKQRIVDLRARNEKTKQRSESTCSRYKELFEDKVEKNEDFLKTFCGKATANGGFENVDARYKSLEEFALQLDDSLNALKKQNPALQK